MTPFGVIVVLAAILILTTVARRTARYWQRYAEEDREHTRTLRVWIIKGMLVPILIWMFLNSGILERLPPILPQVEMARSRGGGWFGAWLIAMINGALIMASYWAAVTFGWLIFLVAIHTESRRDLLGASIFWGLLLSPLAGLFLYLGGLPGLGFAALVWLVPITRDLFALGTPRKLPPVYAGALAKIRLGKYNEAEMAVIRELEKREDDFEGWLMLAELYANHFKDLPEAERLIAQLCSQRTTSRTQVAMALHRLADWHLNLANDPIAACGVLERICEKFPATHLADVARSRIAELAAKRATRFKGSSNAAFRSVNDRSAP